MASSYFKTGDIPSVKALSKPPMPRRQVANADEILRSHIRKTYSRTAWKEAWRNLPEIPSSSEIMPRNTSSGKKDSQSEDWNEYQNDPIYDSSLPRNIIDGAWASKLEYIGTHYQILREDAVGSLRRAVQTVNRNPEMMDDEATCIYTGVTVKGLNVTRQGVAFRVEFSYDRAGKQIRWEQSKRLMQGSIVALTPHGDMFNTVCKIAIIAARPILGGLDQDPPMVDLFWGDIDESVVDPVEKYVMVEAREAYFEASRHMLVAMQKLATEKFGLANHIVGVDQNLKAPEYVEDHPEMDLTSLNQSTEPSTPMPPKYQDPLFNVDVLTNFPRTIEYEMDTSQLSALENMLTKRVSIIQGPPGTGKTFVSIVALRIIVRNLREGDPPIIIAAQTNHAVDQLLNNILRFEPNILRLGGRSDKENLAIRKRTLYELRMETEDVPDGRRGLKQAAHRFSHHSSEIKRIINPLLRRGMLRVQTLVEHRLITEQQRDSLFDDGWEGIEDDMDLSAWLTDDQIMPIIGAPKINLSLSVEDEDIEWEQLKELEEELAPDNIPEELDALAGELVLFNRTATGRHRGIVNKRKIKKLLDSITSLYQIPVPDRGEVYRYFELCLDGKMLRDLQMELKSLEHHTSSYSITKSLCNIRLVNHIGVKVIGCTTTGLSKYRAFLSALQPRTMLIEEAAETLEGKIIGGMFNSLEHLILVGDHQQLQAGCTIRALEEAPYHMNVSMFERLVRNSLPYIMLKKQRRMVPEIRKLLCIEPQPFYRSLEDHSSVLDRKNNRPLIPGMGNQTVYFFHHNWPEGRNADMSCFNGDEADMVVGFFNYLVLNGMNASQITVLTFYNGQRKAILKQLKSHPSLSGSTYFNVFTVDSYQGEENDVILLSLVRSNDRLSIGFLENRNRLVVALSRARRGLYLFGNVITLASSETTDMFIGRDPLWNPLLMFLRSQGQLDLDGGLPIICKKHKETVRFFEPDQWLHFAGGCDKKCDEGDLDCGHPCPHKCHPFDHSRILCSSACVKKLTCGHGCSRNCSEECFCDLCGYNGEKEVGEWEAIKQVAREKFEEQQSSWQQKPLSESSRAKSASSGIRTKRGNVPVNTARSAAAAPSTLVPVSNSSALIPFQLRERPSDAPADGFLNADSSNPMASTENFFPSGGSLSTTMPLPLFMQHPSSQVSRRSGFGRGISSPIGASLGSLDSEMKSKSRDWQLWDAQKADEEVLKHRRAEAASIPQVNESLVIRETYLPVAVSSSGERAFLSQGPIHRVLTTPMKGMSQMSQQAALTPEINKQGVEAKSKPKRKQNNSAGVAEELQNAKSSNHRRNAIDYGVLSDYPADFEDNLEENGISSRQKKPPKSRGLSSESKLKAVSQHRRELESESPPVSPKSFPFGRRATKTAPIPNLDEQSMISVTRSRTAAPHPESSGRAIRAERSPDKDPRISTDESEINLIDFD